MGNSCGGGTQKKGVNTNTEKVISTNPGARKTARETTVIKGEMRITDAIRRGIKQENVVTASSAGYAGRHSRQPPAVAEISFMSENKEAENGEEAGVGVGVERTDADSARAQTKNHESENAHQRTSTTPQKDPALNLSLYENEPVKPPKHLFNEPTLFSPKAQSKREDLSQKKRNAHAKILKKRQTYAKVLQEVERLKESELRMIGEHNEPVAELLRRLMEKNQSVFALEPKDIHAFFVQEEITGEQLLKALGQVRLQAAKNRERATSKHPDKFPFKCKITSAPNLLSGKARAKKKLRIISDEEIEMILNLPAVALSSTLNKMYLVKTKIGEFYLPHASVINAEDVQSAISELEPASPVRINSGTRESTPRTGRSLKSHTSVAQLKSRAQNKDAPELIFDPAYSNRISSTQPSRAKERNLVAENRILGKRKEALTTKTLQNRLGNIKEAKKEAEQRASRKTKGSSGILSPKTIKQKLKKKEENTTMDRVKRNKILTRRKSQSNNRPNVKSLLEKGEARMNGVDNEKKQPTVNRKKFNPDFVAGSYILKEDFETKDEVLFKAGTKVNVTEINKDDKCLIKKQSYVEPDCWIPFGILLKLRD